MPAQNGGSECAGNYTSVQECNPNACTIRQKGRLDGLPKPKIVLLGEEYDGSSDKWVDPDSGIECTLGSSTTYDNGTKSFHFDYTLASLITCPYDISPSKHTSLTIEVVFKFDEDFNPEETLAWIVGNDDGGYDRALILSDARFGGVGSGVGYTYNSGVSTPPNGVWHHGVATFRQGVTGGSFITINGVLGKKVRENGSDGRSEFSIGGVPWPQSTWGNLHGIKGHVRAVFIYEYFLDEETAPLAYSDINENLQLLNAGGPGKTLGHNISHFEQLSDLGHKKETRYGPNRPAVNTERNDMG